MSGPPELLVEICRSSAAFDLHQKLELYQEADVPEYLAILQYEREIRWHFLERGSYRELTPDAQQIWKSRVFPGLWINAPALLEGKMQLVLEALQKGLDSEEHQAFVRKLAASKSARKRTKRK